MATPPYPAPPGPPTQYGIHPLAPKPVAAFVLSLIGGVFILLAGASELYTGYLGATLVLPSGLDIWIALLGLIGVALGVLAITFSVLLFQAPEHHVLYGALIVIVAALSVLSYWGFIVGLVLGIVGGALAIGWTPYRVPVGGYGFSPPGPSPYPIYPGSGLGSGAHRVCLRCGMVVAPDVKFCPHCGNSLGP